MGEAFITRRGGGGAGLNFKVVGGTIQPSNPKENTIWLNTAQEITRWDFSAEQPYLVSKTKNFICYPFYDPTFTTNGVAYTDNGDGTVKANGTASLDATFRLSFIGAVGHATYLPTGKYFLSGCPAGGSSAKYRVEAKSVASGATLAADYGAGAGFELDAPDVVRCNIVVAKGATASNLTFKPQLEKGSAATAFAKGDATGQVWIATGTDSTVEFNALKKNGVQICPTLARQLFGKDWPSMNAMSYHAGEWLQFSHEFSATINIAYPAGSVCTCSDGTTTLTAPDTNGTWACIVPNTGTWTVSCTNGTESTSEIVSITTDGQSANVTLDYMTYLLNDNSITGGWVESEGPNNWGHDATWSLSGGKLTFKTTDSGDITLTTKNAISFTNVDTLYFDATHNFGNNADYDKCYVKVGSAVQSVIQKGSNTVDVSKVTGTQKIAFWFQTDYVRNLTISNLRF